MYLDLELLEEKYARGEYIHQEYIPTTSFFAKYKVSKYEQEISYMYANLTFNELKDAIDNLKEFDEYFNQNPINRKATNLYNNLNYKDVFIDFDEDSKTLFNDVEQNMVKYYVLSSRAMNIASDTCEYLGKAILLKEGLDWKGIKNKGHNLYEIYSLIKDKYKDAFSDLTTEEITTLQQMSSKEVSNKINITSRYPGEQMVKGDINLLLKLTNSFYKASLMAGNIYNTELVSYEKNNNLEITEKVFEQNKNNINYLNTDLMVEEVATIINNYSYEYIFTTKPKDENERIKIYTLRSKLIKKSCDIFEHFSNAFLREEDKSWEELRDRGHDIKQKYHSLDHKMRLSLILETLFKYDELSSKEKVLERLLESNDIDEDIKQDLQDNYLDQNKHLNIKPSQIKGIVDNYTLKIENLDRKQLEKAMDKLFTMNISDRLNIMSRFPGKYYINSNAAFILNLAYAISTESLDKRKQKVKK